MQTKGWSIAQFTVQDIRVAKILFSMGVNYSNSKFLSTSHPVMEYFQSHMKKAAEFFDKEFQTKKTFRKS